MNATTTRFTALVLAGSRNLGAAGLNGKNSKATLPVNGVPMIGRVVETLSAASYVDRIVVCGPEGLGTWPGVELFPTAGSPSRSVAGFLENYTGTWPVLVTTADHALLTPEMVDHFCRQTLQHSEDVTVGLADGDMVAAAYPHSRRTFYKFRDGRWCGCNLFGLKSSRSLNVVRFWRSIEDNRKSPFKVVGAFGLFTLLGVLMRRWTLSEAIARAAARCNVTASPVTMPWPEAAIDVDTLDDMVLAEAIIASKNAATAA